MATSTEDPRYCDIVMKGGITSGLVYPRAVVELSRHYLFKNIGGASVGAIAAAATAAAELSRRHDQNSTSFARLSALPDELAQSDARGQTRLLSLFIPQTSTKPLFDTLLSALNRKTAGGRIGGVLFGAIKSFWLYVLAGLAIGAAIGIFCSRPGLAHCVGVWCLLEWVPIVVVAVVFAAIGLAIGIYRSVTHALVDNGFGLCRGHDASRNVADIPAGEEQLTLWLSRLINRFAGLPPDADPLTFGDLWKAPGFPPPWLPLTAAERKEARSIDLQMMTSDLTLGRPYRLPFAHDERVFFDPAEMRLYFPEHVVRWMERKSVPYVPTASDPPELPAKLLQLPDAADLPLVFAARLSLSFPILFSAVPLWQIDYEPSRESGLRQARRCWFSDGGICSNFPIHFFDSMLPLWPTFGIDLEDTPKYRPDERVYMPERNQEGFGATWNRFDEAGKSGFDRLAGFLIAILGTAKDWRDTMQSRVPGFRDRVARIRLKEGEGGLNLNMDPKTIAPISDAGAEAAQMIIRRFVYELPTPKARQMGWDNHRWVRLRSLLAIVEQQTPRLMRAFHANVPAQASYGDLVELGVFRDVNQYPFQDASASTRAMHALDELDAVAAVLSPPPQLTEDAPQPAATLRITPNI